MKVATGALFVCVLLNIASAFPENISNVYDYEANLVVQTTAGSVRGETGGTTVGGRKQIYRFRSIPYAETPVGNLRFEVKFANFTKENIQHFLILFT